MYLHSCRDIDDTNHRLGKWRKGDYHTEIIIGKSPEYEPDKRKANDCVLLVHGYCNELSDVRSAYAKIDRHMGANTTAYDMRGFTWPSAGRFFRYWSDLVKARRSRVALGNVISDLNKTYDKVSIIAHSMGALCVLHALKKGSIGRHQLHKIILHGGDALWRRFKRTGSYGSHSHKVEQLISFYSANDRVVRIVSKIGRPFKRIGDNPMPFEKPGNFYHVDADAVDTTQKVRHNDYKDSAAILGTTHQYLVGIKRDEANKG